MEMKRFLLGSSRRRIICVYMKYHKMTRRLIEQAEALKMEKGGWQMLAEYFTSIKNTLSIAEYPKCFSV